MVGRFVRFLAATAAITVVSVSAASAGWYGDSGCCGVSVAPVANWGCASSGCAPLYTPPVASDCCAPVRWGCGSSCGVGNGGYAYGAVGYGVGGYEDVEPLHVVNQGPSYDLPLTGYTYPVAAYAPARAYPYAPSYFGYRYGYRRA